MSQGFNIANLKLYISFFFFLKFAKIVFVICRHISLTCNKQVHMTHVSDYIHTCIYKNQYCTK